MASYVVRYGVMRFLGVFAAHGNATYRRGMRVIARTDRGLEDGEVLCEATEVVLAALKDPAEGQILREMTAEDVRELARIQEQAGRELEVCQRYVAKLGLAMQLVDVEHIFGGERVVVYYLAENRVDFRELVKLLAGEFQTRIEMRQIGVRDEAKLLADYGDCGVPVCCNTHLVQMPPVSMKMAKLQKATLGPDEDFRPLRAAEVLPALRVRDVRAEGVAAGAARTAPRPTAQSPAAGAAESRTHARSRDRPTAARRPPLPAGGLSSSCSRPCTTPRTCWAWAPRAQRAGRAGRADEEETGPQRHVTGQELCEAIRRYALEQYGYMAKMVLNNWGLRGTGDFGEIVFNLIRIGRMRKTPQRPPRGFRQRLRFRDRLPPRLPHRDPGKRVTAAEGGNV